MIITLDANVLVDAVRQPAALDRFKAFLGWALPSVVLSSVVVSELIVGAKTAKSLDALDAVLAPFERRRRIIAPSAAAWERAARVMAAAGGQPTASRWHDALLACHAREHGWTVITRDQDFAWLRRHVSGLKIAAPYPQQP